ncbi:hypothetical protein CHGG_09234 [Chaetomium globosum CBS 148.51]|uniref:Alpha/beta hydrolase fold-3 domain-containing protein n=1 Tax=Chaetomium globosum (strain ATCC 6205 / CBS 148.51 / DSM 1962 / NBRC 6347 / NRRL 1970) TaxID=306901 RepID=Q2GS20_CHAGB|nr:uncharacterized protein CHGG_09234 [Chaetomium globosum CBS 148.51]EAQ85220.1 hypothetical protein CHGG_09234 [Chaetomium globosum CBS 148.51]
MASLHSSAMSSSASTVSIKISELPILNRTYTSSPLIILIPPISQPRPGAVAPVPGCFHDYPTAVINYRWQLTEEEEPPEIPLHWPTPLHDVNFGYSWIMENLGSGTDPRSAPRPAYVYGSYLGASLAAGLALTESHVPIRSLPMTIRGLMAHNGIYNWTMFLPDHPIHKAKPVPNTKRKNNYPLYTSHDGATEEEGIFSDLKAHAPTLFRDPSNLFDPFASACLFFQTAHLHVPDDFTTPLSDSHSDALEPSFRAAIDCPRQPPIPPHFHFHFHPRTPL